MEVWRRRIRADISLERRWDEREYKEIFAGDDSGGVGPGWRAVDLGRV